MADDATKETPESGNVPEAQEPVDASQQDADTGAPSQPEPEESVEPQVTTENLDDYSKSSANEPTQEIDYKERYGNATREFQRLKEKYEPMEVELEKARAALGELGTVLKEDPELANNLLTRLEKQKGMPQSEFQNLVKKEVDARYKSEVKPFVDYLRNKEMQDVMNARLNFEKKYGAQLFKDVPKSREARGPIRQKIGKTAEALLKTGDAKDYADALEKSYRFHYPESLIREGENRAYLNQGQQQSASFSSQTSGKGKKSSSKVQYTKEELEAAKRIDKDAYKAMLEEMA